MNNGFNLMMLMAEILPVNDAVDMLQEAITEYKTDSSPDNFKKVEMFCALIAVKSGVKSVGGLDKATEHLEKLAEAKDFYKRMKL